MDREERLRRGSSFGAVAAAYAEHRPVYPQAAVRWCLDPLPRGPDVTGLRVLDLGAGTGKLTELLARLGADVTAVEPDREMLAELGRQLPGVRALSGSAEAIPLPSGSLDAVLCGQSLHWFDLDAALPEIARVLARGGVLGALWNDDDDRVEWVAGLQAVCGAAASPALSGRRAAAAQFGTDQFGTGQFGTGQFGPDLFTAPERAEFRNGHQRTAGSLLALLATHSKVLVMAPADRGALLADIGAYLAAQPQTSDGEFTLPMVTTALRAVRR